MKAEALVGLEQKKIKLNFTKLNSKVKAKIISRLMDFDKQYIIIHKCQAYEKGSSI